MGSLLAVGVRARLGSRGGCDHRLFRVGGQGLGLKLVKAGTLLLPLLLLLLTGGWQAAGGRFWHYLGAVTL